MFTSVTRGSSAEARPNTPAEPIARGTIPTAFTEFALPSWLQAAIASGGFVTTTPIQAEAIPALLDGQDIVGQARTGSGKTLAYVIPMLVRCDPKLRAPQALTLVPTRELAIQVSQVLTPLAEAMGLKVCLLYGGRSYQPEQKALSRGSQIIVGTPGRTLDHLRQRTLSLEQVRYLVLDEADEMLDRGFGPDVERIVSHAPANRQMALLSATVPEWVIRTARKYMHNALTLQLDAGQATPPEIAHTVYQVTSDNRFTALQSLLDAQADGSVIVFGRTKHGVKKLAHQLEVQGHSVAALQGNLSQNARERVMQDFRSGAVRILIATNVAARGLDIADVEQIINYELPESSDWFTHRAGRTGRMGRAGAAVTFILPEDAVKWRQMQRGLGETYKAVRWPAPEDRADAPVLAAPRATARTNTSGPRYEPAQETQPHDPALFARMPRAFTPQQQNRIARGKIKNLVPDRGFGFIVDEQAGPNQADLFFHRSDVQGTTYDQLRVGQRVAYELGKDARRGTKIAVNVRTK